MPAAAPPSSALYDDARVLEASVQARIRAVQGGAGTAVVVAVGDEERSVVGDGGGVV